MSAIDIHEQRSIAIQRDLVARGQFVDFVRMAWPIVEPSAEYIHGWHIDAICEHEEALMRGQIKKLLVNVPPGFMKSLISQVFAPVWSWIIAPEGAAPGPGTRWMWASFDAKLTLRDARKRLAIMRSPWFLRRWGDRFKLATDPAAGDYANDKGGACYATSIKGKGLGKHVHISGVDDPNKPLECTDVELGRTEEWWRGTAPTRFVDPKDRRFLVIMQRLHDRDLSGIILEDGDFVHLRLPMNYNAKRPCYTPIGGDPRTEDGELLWPERVDESAAKERRNALKSHAAAQEDQEPAPKGGILFLSKNWRHYSPEDIVGRKFSIKVASIDCTFKDLEHSKKKPDYVAMQVWGLSEGKYYLLWRWKEQCGIVRTIEMIRKIRDQFKDVTGFLIEDKANGPAVIEMLEKEIPGIIAVDPQGGKEARATAVSPLYEAHDVLHPDPDMTPGIYDLRVEHEKFPTGAHDDEVDCGTQALMYLHRKNTGDFRAAMAAARKLGLSNIFLPRG